MSKEIRKWVKQEKMIMRLMYRAGLLDGWKLTEMYLESFTRSGKKYRSGKYKYDVYLPEVHYCTVDYFGEADEHSIVQAVENGLYWKDAVYDEETLATISCFGPLSRKGLIKYLRSLPVIISDHKINRIVNICSINC